MIRRRQFIAGLGSVAAWPVVARAQQSPVPVVEFVHTGWADASVVAVFRKGLGETGYVEGQNVMVEYHWLEGQFDRLPAVMADLVRRRVAVIASIGDDPVKLGLVASLARPGGNATGINYFNQEVDAKRRGYFIASFPVQCVLPC